MKKGIIIGAIVGLLAGIACLILMTEIVEIIGFIFLIDLFDRLPLYRGEENFIYLPIFTAVVGAIYGAIIAKVCKMFLK
jgi:uncharacterized membrane protein YeaQ/YmgE (transglycosylase-associated protein family)